MGRHLPETRRFAAAAAVAAPGAIRRSRFALVGGAAFLGTLFLSPASQLRNEFLRDDLGYTASSISLFQLVISLPAGTAVMIAAVTADRYGRRWIGAGGLALGAVMGAISYRSTGIGLWLTASGAVVLTSAAVPALRGYQTELFPTRARAKVGGWLDVVGVAGSAAGLVIVGVLAERWDDLGGAIAVMAIAPILAAVAVIALFPETASTELEVFNTDDPAIDDAATDDRAIDDRAIDDRAIDGTSGRGPAASR